MGIMNQEGFDFDVLKALSDEVRIEILNILGTESMNVQDIADRCSVSRPNVSHHLQILRRAGILQVQKMGKESYYSVQTHKILELAQSLLRYISSGKL